MCRQTRFFPFLLFLSFSSHSCQKTQDTTDPEDKAIEAPAQAEAGTAKPKTTPAPPKETVPLVSCDSLGIPSYEYWIKDLSELRCDSCHNTNFAWNGVILINYDGHKTHRETAEARVRSNLFKKPLDVIEQGIFIKWYEAGMPQFEKDCTNMKKSE